jgi:ATP phosphoribosyltransferase regulatory subunit
VTTRAAIRAEAERLFALLAATGAQAVDADILLPADTLLDLYGEDIRARAYTTTDPVRGEMMLRPDFTVPVVQAHMSHGAEPARYVYAGEVFRRQDSPTDRPNEYLQVGYEVFDRASPETADAEVLALFHGLLDGMDLRVATGDFAVLMDAVRGLATSDRRKAALLRHVWRPRRFHALLDRFAGRLPPPAGRAVLVAELADKDADTLLEAAGPLVGLRTGDDIRRRLAALSADAASPPLSQSEADALDALLLIAGPLPQAADDIAAMTRVLPQIGPATDRLRRRVDALAARGIAVDALSFATTHMQATLEYYDGFVFSFHAADPGLPAIASGGRYDALTARLGQGRSIPAVGGVIRPGLTARLRGGAC